MFGNLINEFPFGSLKNNLEISIKAYQAALIVYQPKTFPVYWAMTQMNMGNVYAERIEGKKTENIEKAINSFQEALKIYTLDAFPYEYAMVQHNMSNVYIERIKGDKAENIKTAIDCCKKALKVRTFEAFPREWANTHIHLVNAYLQTTNLEIIEQKKKENIEIAIGYCENSLIVYNIESFPKEWAKVQNNLGNVYLQRIKGEKEENVEQSINYFLESLRVYKINTFPNEWARGQFNLGGAYLERIKEKKRENLEKAIFYLRESFRIYSYNNFPNEWADSYINLGKAYFERIEGKKTDNLEIAIFCFSEALKVYNVDNFPDQFAKIQNNLGTTYSYRIEGDKAKNLEFAIDCYQQALKIYTFKNFPLNWAGVQVDLAEVYIDRIEENKAENLEIAIACCQASLQVVNSDNFPIHWAKTQNTLGNVYQARIKGDKAENLEIAITCFEAALKIYTIERERFAQKWAMSQMNLGNVYHDRIKGKKAENQEKAIDCFKASLELVKPDDFPLEFAKLQNNLGSAYHNRISEDREQNLENAITCYKEALKVHTFDEFPYDWALTQQNLGTTYNERVKEDKAENLEVAITCFESALRTFTREKFPYEWATTQFNLGNAYHDRMKGDKAKNLELAITANENALTVQTVEALPEKCFKTAHNLGFYGYNAKNWQIAIKGFVLAVKAAETIRIEAVTGYRKQEILSDAIQSYGGLVLTYLNLYYIENNLQHLKTALEYIERSKGRNLVELMTQKNLQPQGVSQQIKVQLDELKQRVVNEQIRLQHQSINHNSMRSDHLTPYVQDHSHLKEYQQDLDDFIAREIKDPLFSLTQKVEPIPFTEIQALTDAETCLLQWYITFEKILAFVVSADGEVKVWQSSENDKNQFLDTFNNYRQLYYSKNGKQEWRNQLSNLLQTFADILHINDILALIPDTCQRLIIIPHLFLHILPIHAFPINKNQILQDKYNIQYAPSCQILQKISQTFHHSEFNKLFAIQNPTKDLFYTDLEVNILSTFFTEPQVIAQDNATKNAVLPHLKSSDNHCYHFSCHGGFNPANPLESALFLANKEPLTLGEIFELRLHKCRLITLSACETGLIDLNSISDEYIGLPSGFLFAGSPSVVSSLWTVNDLSTSFLMIKLYEILFDENQQVSVPVALKMAQNWLKNLTSEQFILEADSMIDKLCHDKPRTAKSYKESARQLLVQNPEEYPFKNPFYWAAFIASGQ
ncbi:CHAT domain-containing protein [Microcystis aeruginosa BLCCF108]|uniref:CHAT domain-containing protein n=1 Tax=Microcystis aeruginosa BLCC-F108 TaxID=2755317 RepID=A0A841UWG2_MICAE|nr:MULTISPECIES: CHAT domain-containing tetratricopeptide repeat protein [Microcystis]MBC1193040.1 CHAT domain-containing protein [Microcystis aeruginosa BLCC-F108]MCA2590551.1 CHAT domain-containing protein [Microcystis sp. M31BS1]